MTPQEKAAGVLVTPTTAHTETKTRAPIVSDPAGKGKAFSTLQAQFALLGHELVQLADGTFVCRRWGFTKPLPDLDAAEAFLRKIGGAA